MLSPRYLSGVSDELVEIYSRLEMDILQDMARRLSRLGRVTDATKWQAEMLSETGLQKKQVQRIIKKYEPEIQKQILATYESAMKKNTEADNKIFKSALGRTVKESNAQMMLLNIQKTRADLSRLTITTALESEKSFIREANDAYMRTVSGAFDYDTSIKASLNKLASEGIRIVKYNNSKPVELSIETAVRINVLTGINQTASAMTLNNCVELGNNLVETSAHYGARPEHEAWQGKVFALGESDKYPNFYEVCGYGEVDGICGINCRHSFYPYFEGLDSHYTQDDLDEIASQTVEYNGETLKRYDAEEKLRNMERNIRHWKRKAVTLEAGGKDNTTARQRLGYWQSMAKDFCKQTQLERDYAREYIGTASGKQPAGIPPKE